MKLQQLFVLCAVAEHGGFNRAAKALFLTQPAVSMSLRELERWFGQPLINRGADPLELTALGREVYRLAREMRDRHTELAQIRERIIEGEKDHVAISYTVTAGAYVLTPELTAFQQSHPHVRVALHYRPPEQVVTALLEGQTDFGLVLNPADDERLTPVAQWPDALCAVIATDKMTDPPPAISAHTPLILPPEGPYLTRRLINQIFRNQFGTPPVSYLEIGNPEGVKQAVLTTGQPGILLHRTIARELASGVLTPVSLNGFPHSCQHVLLYRTPMRPSRACRD